MRIVPLLRTPLSYLTHLQWNLTTQSKLTFAANLRFSNIRTFHTQNSDYSFPNKDTLLTYLQKHPRTSSSLKQKELIEKIATQFADKKCLTDFGVYSDVRTVVENLGLGLDKNTLHKIRVDA
jgi:hypothetical protein